MRAGRSGQAGLHQDRVRRDAERAWTGVGGTAAADDEQVGSASLTNEVDDRPLGRSTSLGVGVLSGAALDDLTGWLGTGLIGRITQDQAMLSKASSQREQIVPLRNS